MDDIQRAFRAVAVSPARASFLTTDDIRSIGVPSTIPSGVAAMLARLTSQGSWEGRQLPEMPIRAQMVKQVRHLLSRSLAECTVRERLDLLDACVTAAMIVQGDDTIVEQVMRAVQPVFHTLLGDAVLVAIAMCWHTYCRDRLRIPSSARSRFRESGLRRVLELLLQRYTGDARRARFDRLTRAVYDDVDAILFGFVPTGQARMRVDELSTWRPGMGLEAVSGGAVWDAIVQPFAEKAEMDELAAIGRMPGMNAGVLLTIGDYMGDNGPTTYKEAQRMVQPPLATRRRVRAPRDFDSDSDDMADVGEEKTEDDDDETARKKARFVQGRMRAGH